MNSRLFAILLCIIQSSVMGGCRRATKPEGAKLPVKEAGYPSATDALGEYCLKKIRPDKRPNLEIYVGGNIPQTALGKLLAVIEKAGMKVSPLPAASKNGALPRITLLVQDFSVQEQSANAVLNTIYGPRNGSEERLVFRKADDGWVLQSARETAVY